MNKIKHKKLICIWIFILLLSFFFYLNLETTKASATTFTVTFSESKFFEARGLIPGQGVSKTFEITNNETTEKTVHLFAREQGSNPLKNVLQVEVTGGFFPLSIPLADLYNLPDTDTESNKFDRLAPNETKTYTLSAELSPSAGNEFQGQTTTFDVSFGVKGATVLAAQTNDPSLLGVLALPNTGTNLLRGVVITLFLGFLAKLLEKTTKKFFLK